ncbi:DUF2587 domain-containing protein [Egibacter rhizosphaerae]|uniref:Bacterial proteasome activator n=1 Tax=Egibacter rhizosphaerae TaxID=1670831 RepID=A0A411YE19_9ACTN|nr:proteasome activator [Egibacter rhizosphaerae]QBI19392.1 DUF2587 domain-containing protein [Egibacter rhizosphaerae]
MSDPNATPAQGQEAASGGDDSVEMVEHGRDGSSIHEPTKLMRIAVMLREMQEEVRRAEPDEGGRQQLRQVQERAVAEMRAVLSQDLQDELDALLIPHQEDAPSESQIRIAQAQLIGWLEGLFQGIQAAVFNQQMQARQQLEQMRQQGALPPGPQGSQGGRERHGTGQYL